MIVQKLSDGTYRVKDAPMDRKKWTDQELIKARKMWKSTDVRTRRNWSTTFKRRMEEMMFEGVDRGLWK